MSKPMGISEYKLTGVVPKELEDMLPSTEDIEKRIQEKYKTE